MITISKKRWYQASREKLNWFLKEKKRASPVSVPQDPCPKPRATRFVQGKLKKFHFFNDISNNSIISIHLSIPETSQHQIHQIPTRFRPVSNKEKASIIYMRDNLAATVSRELYTHHNQRARFPLVRARLDSSC